MGRGVMINPELIAWATERSGLDRGVLVRRFPGLLLWQSGERQPTLPQLTKFAKATLTPLGAMFLEKPPADKLPVADFRMATERKTARPSAALLETIYEMQRRQDWMREYLVDAEQEPLRFIGRASVDDEPQAVAQAMREVLGIAPGWAREHRTWEGRLLGLRRAIEAARIMVVFNGVVGNNTHHRLDPDEFRGFVLCDSMAPLIFVNGADWKAAQPFTIAHELAHLWVGSSGVSDLPRLRIPAGGDRIERFCNVVAGEFLVPSEELEKAWGKAKGSVSPLESVASEFRVSRIVAARRALDRGLISEAEYGEVWAQKPPKRDGKGGDFFKSATVRVGHLFGSAVVRAARSGRLLYQDAYRLTGLHGRTFDVFAKEIGVDAP